MCHGRPIPVFICILALLLVFSLEAQRLSLEPDTLVFCSSQNIYICTSKTPFRFGKHKHIAKKIFSRLSYLYTYPLQIKSRLTDLLTYRLTDSLTD